MEIFRRNFDFESQKKKNDRIIQNNRDCNDFLGDTECV